MTNITADYFRSTKIKILSPEHSKQVQEAVFAVGGRWRDGSPDFKNYECAYLRINYHLDIMFGSHLNSFDSMSEREITFPPKEEENVMTEEWKPVVGEYANVLTGRGLMEVLVVGFDSEGGAVFEVSSEMETFQLFPKESFVSYPVNMFRPIPKTKLIHGVEVPDISFVPRDMDSYYFPTTSDCNLFSVAAKSRTQTFKHRVDLGMCYPHTEEGKQAAILHAKAMLGIVDKG